MKKLETANEFCKGALAGMIGNLVAYPCVEIFHWLGITRYGLGYLAGDTVFQYQNNLLMNVIALLISTGCGMWWGIVIAFLFTKVFTTRHYWFKISFAGFCIFFFHLGFLDEPFHYDRALHQHTLDLVIIMLGYQIFTLILGVGLRKMGLSSDSAWD